MVSPVKSSGCAVPPVVVKVFVIVSNVVPGVVEYLHTVVSSVVRDNVVVAPTVPVGCSLERIAGVLSPVLVQVLVSQLRQSAVHVLFPEDPGSHPVVLSLGLHISGVFTIASLQSYTCTFSFSVYVSVWSCIVIL